ncbi:methyl-accepting chemotaxis protein [Clostridiisalibacter paucivorans]|uniref:methyl-accepting chemotaxis protein n=1 Tax=Clostridiisalibacter paucivorans TaxID=408753 RepID=UPI00047AF92A|nr:methyl-accepting chemotaxis protein [Clostridiisalibacter paucivorans]
MKSIRLKFVVPFSILILILCTVLSSVAYWISSDTIINNVTQELPQKANDAAKFINAKVEKEYGVLEQVAKEDIFTNEEFTWQQKKNYLKGICDKLGYKAMGITDDEGILFSTENTVASFKDENYIKSALYGKNAISNPMISKIDQTMEIAFSVPIRKDDVVVGVLVGFRDGNYWCDLIEDISFGESGEAFILNEVGTVIGHKNPEYVIQDINYIKIVKENPSLQALSESAKKMIAGQQGYGEYTIEGMPKYIGYSPIENTSWSMGMTVNKDEMLSGLDRIKSFSILGTIIALGLGILFTSILSVIIAKPIITVANRAEEMSKLIFENNIEQKYIDRNDEIGTMSKAFQMLIENLRSFVSNVADSSEQVASSAEELTATSQQSATASESIASSSNEMANSADTQLNEIVNVVDAMENIAESIENIANNSNEIKDMNNKTLSASNDGKNQMDNVITKMKSIETSSNNIKMSLQDINNSSVRMNDIIELIMDISEQTNLLALNAAIEAARAGEHGKGFAVVAEEVRKLAEESQHATEDISKLILENQQRIEKTNSIMEKDSENVNDGINAVNNAKSSFDNIVKSIENMTQQINDIAQYANKVSSESQHIMDSAESIESTSKRVAGEIQNVSAATEEQTASMEEISSACESLAQLAQNLQSEISKFKL